MDPQVYDLKENPLDSANPLSKLFFAWIVRLYKKGVKKGLEIGDLYKNVRANRSDILGDSLEKEWDKQVNRAKVEDGKPSLTRAIASAFLGQYMVYGVLLFVQFVFLRTLAPFTLRYYLELFADERRREEDAEMWMYIFAGLMSLTSLCVVFTQHHCTAGQMQVGMRVRVAVSSLVYRKLLRLNRKSMGQTAAGQVVNLLSNDVSRFDFASFGLHYLWITPFQIVLVTYLVYDQVGVAAFAGIASMILITFPIQGYLAKLTSSIRSKTAACTDKRVRLMNEIISGIQIIKMYAWEKPFEKLVALSRKNEIRYLTYAAYIRGVFLSCMVFIERMTLYLTVITYALMDNVITADRVYSMSQYFNLLQLSIAIFLPMAISFGAESYVSIQRLQDFLVLEEKRSSSLAATKDKQITLSDVEASWTGDAVTLNKISFQVPQGKLCAIVGPVGSGKSSILQLLLGELLFQGGKVSVSGSVSYSSQEPWLFGSSVRSNILFGQKFDMDLYKDVTKVCALLPDFQQFPSGDEMLVGERGVSLSGGQRARINLARAVYRQADIYLLDDPLSAVDTHVGKQLFEECIMGYLGGKTRILVTHQLQYLKKADLIIVLSNGTIEAQGSFDELANSSFDFTKMLVAANESDKEKTEEVKTIVRQESVKSTKDEEEFQKLELAPEEIGLTDKSAIVEYFKASGNYCALFAVGFVIVLAQVACNGADLWLSFWTNQEEIRHRNDTEPDQIRYFSFSEQNLMYLQKHKYNKSGYHAYDSSPQSRDDFDWDLIFKEPIDTNWAIYIYSILIAIIIVLVLTRSFAFFKLAVICSKNLHAIMFHSLLKAPMRFFDVNPSGRILNRFSKDIGAADEMLPRVMIEAAQVMLVMFGILIMVVISNYYMAIPIVVFGILFIMIRKWYLQNARVLKHMEGVGKSPVFSHLNSSLNGIVTIRSCQTEEQLVKEFDQLQDLHSSAWTLTIYCSTSFGLWLDLISILFTSSISFGFVLLQHFTEVSGSAVGLAISQSLILTGMVQYGVRQSAEVINQLTSVERILQYTTLDEEGPFETPTENKQTSWPSKGHVRFKSMSLKYTPDDPPVLRNLNFEIKSGEKVGIVGRTGAGKSSLIAALFNLAPLEGVIEIDGVDTKSLGLTELRKSISIIPQEPVLFSATVRYNLDPFKEYDDKSLWNALEEVELKEAVPTLDFMVDEGGSNFSLGQRQLVCLARAILRNNKVLVLDEATANVDHRTDALIQKTIRRKFSECTVLTIAHRLNTIMDSDKVLVMSAGQMIEFDHPHLLLQNQSGHFSKMVEQTGASMTKTLRAIAETSFEDRKRN